LQWFGWFSHVPTIAKASSTLGVTADLPDFSHLHAFCHAGWFVSLVHHVAAGVWPGPTQSFRQTTRGESPSSRRRMDERRSGRESVELTPDSSIQESACSPGRSGGTGSHCPRFKFTECVS
jgi:hypothetical protein